jgi:hypothetical protein
MSCFRRPHADVDTQVRLPLSLNQQRGEACGAHQLVAWPAAALIAAGGVGAGVLTLRGPLRALVNVLALVAIPFPACKHPRTDPVSIPEEVQRRTGTLRHREGVL